MKKLLLTIGLGLFLISSSSSASTAATVNGMKITVKEANNALRVLTKGKMNWSKLPKQGKVQLIEMMAPAKLIAVAARKQLSRKEKASAISGYWMQKKMAKIKISDSEAKNAYNKMLKMAKKTKSKAKIPPFNKAKNSLKIQLAQEKIVSKLMKKAKIKVK